MRDFQDLFLLDFFCLFLCFLKFSGFLGGRPRRSARIGSCANTENRISRDLSTRVYRYIELSLAGLFGPFKGL